MTHYFLDTKLLKALPLLFMKLLVNKPLNSQKTLALHAPCGPIHSYSYDYVIQVAY